MSKTKEKESKVEDTWEIKDRTYFLKGNKEPLTFTLKSRHTEKYPLLYFDTETNTQRALRYATNQASPFVDEQKGEATLKHIMFKDGTLIVPREQQALQKLLSLYHPDRDKRYSELKPQVIAQDALVDLNLEILALNAAKEMDIEQIFGAYKYLQGLASESPGTVGEAQIVEESVSRKQNWKVLPRI